MVPFLRSQKPLLAEIIDQYLNSGRDMVVHRDSDIIISVGVDAGIGAVVGYVV